MKYIPSIACSGETFTFKVASVSTDVANLKLVIEASEGQSNGVTRAHGKAVQIKLVASPSTSDVDIRADYVAKHVAPSAAALRSSSATTWSTPPPRKRPAPCSPKPPGPPASSHPGQFT